MGNKHASTEGITSIYDCGTVRTITGEDVDLNAYRGKVLCIVNVANK